VHYKGENMIEEALLQLHKKITKIEEKDENYRTNPKWIDLREKQDIAYKELAERKLHYHKKKFMETGSALNKKFIKIYSDYLGGDENEKHT
jgi:hypothetical protein